MLELKHSQTIFRIGTFVKLHRLKFSSSPSSLSLISSLDNYLIIFDGLLQPSHPLNSWVDVQGTHHPKWDKWYKRAVCSPILLECHACYMAIVQLYWTYRNWSLFGVRGFGRGSYGFRREWRGYQSFLRELSRVGMGGGYRKLAVNGEESLEYYKTVWGIRY